MSDKPENLSGVVCLHVDNIRVAEYHGLPDGMGPPTEVHLLITVPAMRYPLIMRMKSRQVVDELIQALTNHRNHVFRNN
jgi:hypothetical protein